MKTFFEPQSVAVIGASADPHKGGFALVDNLRDHFGNRLYPVNPRYREIAGLPCFPDLAALPETPDLLIVFTPAQTIPDILGACGKKGITRVMIQSGGFAEAGEGGRDLQERCLVLARDLGIRLWGPNCMGIVDGHSRMVASFMRPSIWREHLRPGGVSLIVQSGMLSAGFLMQILSEGYFGLRRACSIGNRMDVDECDILDYLTGDNETRVIGLYLESLRNPGRFRDIVRRLDRPLVLLKGGLSRDGARAARSHTASLSGDATIGEGFFRQLGIHRAFDFIEMMDILRALDLRRPWPHPPEGVPPRFAVVTFSGAAGIVTADHLAARGLALAALSEETLQALREIYPPWMPPANPVDIWPAIEKVGPLRGYGVTLQALLEDPGVHGIFLHLFVDAETLEQAPALLSFLGQAPKPLVFWIIGDSRCFRDFRDLAAVHGLPVYLEIGRAVQAMEAMVRAQDPRGG